MDRGKRGEREAMLNLRRGMLNAVKDCIPVLLHGSLSFMRKGRTRRSGIFCSCSDIWSLKLWALYNT